MGSLVSSRYHYMQEHPHAQISYSEMEHELKHLKRREQLSGVITVGALVLSMLTLAGILGGSVFILGALLAIAAFAAAYAHCCRQAESGLKDHQISWHVGSKPVEVAAEGASFKREEKPAGGLLGFLPNLGKQSF